jgi:predicted transcriptional regulator
MTTTVRIEPGLKGRLAAAAERSGQSPHAFIVNAIEAAVEQAEVEGAFEQLAESRWAAWLGRGTSVPLEAAAAWAEARARGERPRRPAPAAPRKPRG